MTVFSVRPAAGRKIAPCPSTWYLAAASADLKPRQILALRIGETELVLYRDARGEAHALAAHCVHMGCHLKTGTVIDDRLRCPLHFRQFDGAGRCRAVPGGRAEGAPQQPSYPLDERYGAIFVYIGDGPLFDLPMPHGLAHGDCASRVLEPFAFPLPWHALVANGCDLDHLQTVHLRQLKEPPTVGALPGRRFQVRYRTRVLGKRPADLLLRQLSGDDVRASITCFGGSLMLVESMIGRRRSFLLLSMLPQPEGTVIRCLVGMPRGRWHLADEVGVRTAAWLFHAFLSRDVGVLEGQRLHRPEPLITAGDRYLAQLFDYFENLDRAPVYESATEA